MEMLYPATNEKGEYYLYDDDGKGVTNQTILRALSEGWEAIKVRRKRMEMFEQE